ncbi:hypothetical protein DM02DRAFT_678291, partial [Periconia macrospinosa]
MVWLCPQWINRSESLKTAFFTLSPMFPSTSALLPITITVLAAPASTPRLVVLEHHEIKYDEEAIQLLPCNAEWGKLETSSP